MASNAANVALILLNLGLIRFLDTGDYGAVAALLGVNLVGTVPGLALQVVLARRTATAPTDRNLRGALWTVLLVWSGVVALAVGLLTVALSPVLTALLHLDSTAPMLWLAASLVPFVLVSAVQGLLQGAERFAALSVSLGLVGVGKLVGGLGGVPWGVSGVLAGTAVAALLATAASVGLLVGDLRRPRHGVAGDGVLTELRGATSGVFGLFALQNLDVVLARHLLPAQLSGVYAAGSLTAKGVFWLLHVVAVVVFPRLSDPDQRRHLLRRAFWLVSAGLVVAALAATAGGPPDSSRRSSGRRCCRSSSARTTTLWAWWPGFSHWWVGWSRWPNCCSTRTWRCAGTGSPGACGWPWRDSSDWCTRSDTARWPVSPGWTRCV